MNRTVIVFTAVMFCLLTHAATPAKAALNIAGELIVDLRASEANAASNIWVNQATSPDSVGNFTAVNNVDVQLIGGETGVFIDGSDGNIFRAGLAPATITGGENRSIEVWAYNPSVEGHETMIGWAHRGGAAGSNLSFTFGNNAAHGAVGHWGAPDIGWSPVPTAAEWHHLVYVYDDSRTPSLQLYVDGQPNVSDNVSLVTLSNAGTFVNLGAQNVNDVGDLFEGERFTGYLANVRVHSGALTADDVLNNFNEGIFIIPEPSSIVLLATSLLGLIGLRRRRRRRS